MTCFLGWETPPVVPKRPPSIPSGLLPHWKAHGNPSESPAVLQKGTKQEGHENASLTSLHFPTKLTSPHFFKEKRTDLAASLDDLAEGYCLCFWRLLKAPPRSTPLTAMFHTYQSTSFPKKHPPPPTFLPIDTISLGKLESSERGLFFFLSLPLWKCQFPHFQIFAAHQMHAWSFRPLYMYSFLSIIYVFVLGLFYASKYISNDNHVCVCWSQNVP